MSKDKPTSYTKSKLSPIRKEPIPDGQLKKYQEEDEDVNQTLDWSDIYQRYCKRHKRSYHIKCKECYPN